jgi:hypothetical protein
MNRATTQFGTATTVPMQAGCTIAQIASDIKLILGDE